MCKRLFWVISTWIFTFGFVKTAFAHQPNYLASETAVRVSEPEISKAYYGKLDGFPTMFLISSSNQFDLYVNLLVPDVPGVKTGFQVSIFDPQNNLLANFTGGNWERYYEKFARDWYLKGPEYEKKVPAGNYTIILTNQGNKGVYAMAIGKVESFPPKVLLTLFPELIKIKTQIFNKPWYEAFINIFGLGLLVILLTIGTVVFMIRKRKRVRKN